MKQRICHCLIGPPGCGKSSFAQAWIAHSSEYVWVSTDQIRTDLFGEMEHDGDWSQIEAVVIQQIEAAIQSGRPVIYDATNVRRSWRLSFMQRVAAYPVRWIAWQFTTSLETCKAQNEGRQRQVPERVIENYYQWMQAFEPDVAEGFAAVHPVPFRDGQFDFEVVEMAIATLMQSIQKRRNKNASRELHPYSSLLAFEQLIYLIAALMQYPGLGNLQATNPALLKRELGQEPAFSTEVAEISALLKHQYGQVYADEAAIQQNLIWLQQQGLLNAPYTSAEFNLPTVADVPLESLHRYSDQDAFRRLMHLIRFIAHHPLLFADAPAQKTADCLLEALLAEGNVQIHYSAATLRKDIETVLKPYRLMGEKRLRRGYFVGTGILSGAELLRVYHSLEGQAKHLSDPIALNVYETFRQRIAYLGLDVHQSYPVRKVVDQPIVDTAYLSDLSLAQTQNSSRLEAAIQTCEVIELRRLLGTGRFPQDTETPFEVRPIQIVFYNIAWYLGYQRLNDGLFQYERLDRLTARFTGRFYEYHCQRQALEQLNRLQQASYGLYLGIDAKLQQQFLGSATERSAAEAQIELWFTTEIFRFVSEGTRRFANIQMSSRKSLGISMTSAEQKQVFTLQGTGAQYFPHRLKASLPCWSIESLELQGWILRFGQQVKVITPDSLVEKIVKVAGDITKTYR